MYLQNIFYMPTELKKMYIYTVRYFEEFHKNFY